MRLVLGEAARDIVVGVVLGVAAGTVLCSVLDGSLENVAAVDPIVIGAAAVIISAVGIGAALVPALRTLRVHPAEVLRA